jgi:hypothetical protein
MNFAKKLRSWVNSIKIPSLVDFVTKPLSEAKKNAPKENWDRLGLGKKSEIGIKTWVLFFIPFALFILFAISIILTKIYYIIRDLLILSLEKDSAILGFYLKSEAVVSLFASCTLGCGFLVLLLVFIKIIKSFK